MPQSGWFLKNYLGIFFINFNQIFPITNKFFLLYFAKKESLWVFSVHQSIILFNNIPITFSIILQLVKPILKNIWACIYIQNLPFDIHIKTILTKLNRTLGLLQKFQQVLPKPSLITLYKAFTRPHLDYGDVVFDQVFNNSFHQRSESVQYNASLAITGAIRGTFKEKLYQ